MKIKLYQVNPEKDTKQVMFMPYGMIDSVNREIYIWLTKAISHAAVWKRCMRSYILITLMIIAAARCLFRMS